MSVTFAAQFQNSDITGYNVVDLFSFDVIDTFDTYDVAVANCGDGQTVIANLIETPELNVSNGNAMSLLRELGIYDGEPCGQIDPTDLLDRVLLLDAIEDPGTDPITVPGDETTATMIDCGRRAGTMNRYAAALRAVAEYAQAQGLPVTYA